MALYIIEVCIEYCGLTCGMDIPCLATGRAATTMMDSIVMFQCKCGMLVIAQAWDEGLHPSDESFFIVVLLSKDNS